MENKSLKRGSVSKYRNVEAKRRRVTIVEKDISPNLYDQNIAIVENLMQKCIRPMMTEIVTNVMSSLLTSQLVSNRSTYKGTSDDGDISIIPSPEVETIDIIDVKEEISIKDEPENPIVIIDEDEESIKDESKETIQVQRIRKHGRTPIAAKQGSIERKVKKEKDDHTSTSSEESIGGKDDSKNIEAQEPIEIPLMKQSGRGSNDSQKQKKGKEVHTSNDSGDSIGEKTDSKNVGAQKPIEDLPVKQSGSPVNNSQRQTEGGKSTEAKMQMGDRKECCVCRKEVVLGDDYKGHLMVAHSEFASDGLARRDKTETEEIPKEGSEACEKAAQNISKDVEKFSNSGKKKRKSSMGKDTIKGRRTKESDDGAEAMNLRSTIAPTRIYCPGLMGDTSPIDVSNTSQIRVIDNVESKTSSLDEIVDEEENIEKESTEKAKTRNRKPKSKKESV